MTQADKLKTCPDCGNIVSIRAEACPKCGALQKPDSSQPSSPAPEPLGPENSKVLSRRKLIFIGVAAVFVVLLIGVAATHVLNPRRDPKAQPSYDYWKQQMAIDVTNSLSEEEKINKIKALPTTNVDNELLDLIQRDVKIRTELAEIRKTKFDANAPGKLVANMDRLRRESTLMAEASKITQELQPLAEKMKKRYGFEFTK